MRNNNNNNNNNSDENEKINDRKSIQQQYLKQIQTEIEKSDSKEEQKQYQKQTQNSELEQQFNILLQKAEKYASFLVSRHSQKRKQNKQNIKKRGHYNEEKSEEEQLINEEIDENNDNFPTILQSQPKILKNEKLKDYQMVGLNWLVSLYETGLNGILADDMGLGKTIQTIALIGFLKEYKKIAGPHLIIAPKSTLGNWVNEFSKWLPCCKVIKLIATKEERQEILENHINQANFDVCITSFEGAKICQKSLKKINFQYIIIDEAHKIKNEESQLSLIVRLFKTNYKILLTGTPLQNNLHELWSLLNFLLPDLFNQSQIFDEWFSASNLSGKNNDENDQKNLQMIAQLHKILKPFMMRRTKAEVMKSLPPKKEMHLYVGLTDLQLGMYKNLLSQKKTLTDNPDDKKMYLNTLMQLRKVCNHPYLFEGVEEDGLPTLGEHLITNCGKMMVLDKLLQKLQKGKHQVLIFSQMTMILDILEDYCNYRQFKYCRIDGNTDMIERDSQISDFTSENSSKFIFLLSTRAGGLGINLATADTVVLYDSDWNPQMDLQAMDRAHRIGQKSIVNVYRLITENTVEEKIIERQTIKLKWDSLIIQQGRLAQKNRVFTKEEIKDIIQFGASAIFKAKEGTYTDEDIELLLQRGEEKTKDYNKNIEIKFNQTSEKIGQLSLSSINIYDFLQKMDDQKFRQMDKEALDEQMAKELANDQRSTRREKKINYNINAQFNNMMATAPIPKAAKIIKLPEHQLFVERERLQELLQKEEDYKCLSIRAKKGEEGGVEENGLTTEENAEKNKYYNTGFPAWLKQEFHCFLQGCERFGRESYQEIADHIKTKTTEEVRDYSKAFWERIDLFTERERIVKNIERGEQLIKQKHLMTKLLQDRCSYYKNVREEFQFNPLIYNKSKSKFYTTENDKFLVIASFEYGYSNWQRIIKEIKTNSLFLFDHFFKSRSEYELNKRLQSLLKVIEKEQEKMKSDEKNNAIQLVQQQLQQQQLQFQQQQEYIQQQNNQKNQQSLQQQQQQQQQQQGQRAVVKPKDNQQGKPQQKVQLKQNTLLNYTKAKETIVIEDDDDEENVDNNNQNQNQNQQQNDNKTNNINGKRSSEKKQVSEEKVVKKVKSD